MGSKKTEFDRTCYNRSYSEVQNLCSMTGVGMSVNVWIDSKYSNTSDAFLAIP